MSRFEGLSGTGSWANMFFSLKYESKPDSAERKLTVTESICEIGRISKELELRLGSVVWCHIRKTHSLVINLPLGAS